MKKIYLLLLVLSPFISFAQNKVRCGTDELWQQMKKEDPSLIERENKINHDMQQWISQHENERNSNTVVTIPVVFHILYYSSAENISDAQCQYQLDQLNLDYAKMNSDTNLIPSVWTSIAGNTSIQFCLAQQTPAGAATTGIERRQLASATSWTNTGNMKHYSTGGLDAWNRNSYCNIWVGNLGNGLLGITQFPGGAAATDGLCILYSTAGSMLNPGTEPNYDLGRTLTHEMGHWLNLYHTFQGGCVGLTASTCGTQGDNVCDTPPTSVANYSCPPTQNTCTETSPFPPPYTSDQNDMTMNYMDYTDDACMYMFTNGQGTRMNACLNTTRVAIKTSIGCQVPLGVSEINFKNFVDVYPNPASSTLNIDTHFRKSTSLDITVCDLLGNTVMKQKESSVLENKINLNIENISNGIYLVTIKTPDASTTQKVSIQH